MVSAIPADVSSPSQTKTSSSGWYFFRVPDLNRETKHQITKASAWPTFMGICATLRHEGRKGRTAAVRHAAMDELRISVGLRHLARDMGLNVSTVRRHVRRLKEIGVIVVHKPPNVSFEADPETGKIRSKIKGRCENTRVYLTIQPHHLRPSKAAGLMGADCAHPCPPDAPCKVQSAPTVRESYKNQRAPDGDAVGIGTPPAVPAGRLPAAEAGGHPAAKASQEEGSVLPLDAGRDEPVLPRGVLKPACKPKVRPENIRRSNQYQESHREPQAFVGHDHDRFQATKARLEREAAERAADDARRRQERLEATKALSDPERDVGRQRANPKVLRPVPVEPPPASNEELDHLVALVAQKRQAIRKDAEEFFRNAYQGGVQS